MHDLKQQNAPDLASSTLQETSKHSQGLRILIIEDEALISVFLGELLQEMGHHVCAIESTEHEAVSSALRLNPDLLIVDKRLREGSGISAVATILGNHFIPHIYMTGERLKTESLHPAAVILQKPFPDSALESAIQKAMAPHFQNASQI